MLHTLGLHNVVQSDEEWPAVGWETIAKANPTFLVIASHGPSPLPRRRPRKKLAFLRSDPVTRNMDAVKHNRIIILDALALQASLRTFDGLEQPRYRHRRLQPGPMMRTLLALALLLLALLAGVAIGETAIEPQVVLQVLANKLWAAGYALDPIDEGVVWNYRLTRTLVAAACGAGLATCG